METFPQDNTEAGFDQRRELVKKIIDMYVRAAERYLDEEDPLRARIISYYSERSETEQELIAVLGKKSDEGQSDYVQDVENFTENPQWFVERMEKLYELQDVHKRRREYMSEDRLATDEEYSLGVYSDTLESQVRDAVFSAYKKGYITFQSGFKEKTDRDQFMDFYNKNISIPADMLTYLQGLSIEVKVEHFDDRTTIALHPTGDGPMRLAQWKEVWDALIESLPPADSEMVPHMKLYEEHRIFQEKQDSFFQNKGYST